MVNILAIDPGLTGAFVHLNFIGGKRHFFYDMPVIKNGKDREIDFAGVRKILSACRGAHVYLERAMPMAMGSKHAFNYGRGFAALEIAVSLSGLPVTYVEPQKWAKVMHAGISADLKPKAKSIIAVRRLFPQYIKYISKNRNDKMHEGIVDALLIAGYALRQSGSGG